MDSSSAAHLWYFYYFINSQPAKFSGATHGMHLSMRAEKKISLGARNCPREAFKKSVELSSRNTFVYHIGIFAGFFETVGKININ